jgi:hypothetical protein
MGIVDTYALSDGKYFLRLTVVDKTGVTITELGQIWIDNCLMPGFPNPDFLIFGNLTIHDVNHDGRGEILAHSGWGASIIDYRGKNIPGWPVKRDFVALFREIPSLSAGDIFGDGNCEIFFTAAKDLRFPQMPSYPIRAVYSDGSNVDGWPANTVTDDIFATALSSVVLEDLSGDGKPEAIVCGYYDGYIYVLNGDGTSYPGWPKQEIPYVDPSATGYGYYHINYSPAVGDVDMDGKKEIVVSSHGPNGNRISIWSSRGMLKNRISSKAVGSGEPVLVDVDGDGRLEIGQVNIFGIQFFKPGGSTAKG